MHYIRDTSRTPLVFRKKGADEDETAGWLVPHGTGVLTMVKGAEPLYAAEAVNGCVVSLIHIISYSSHSIF